VFLFKLSDCWHLKISAGNECSRRLSSNIYSPGAYLVTDCPLGGDNDLKHSDRTLDIGFMCVGEHRAHLKIIQRTLPFIKDNYLNFSIALKHFWSRFITFVCITTRKYSQFG